LDKGAGICPPNLLSEKMIFWRFKREEIASEIDPNNKDGI
jgi:hypothetical protein